MRSRFVMAVGLVVTMTGCRSCSDESSGPKPTSSGPTMPTGMLMPVVRSDAAVEAEGNLRLVRGAKHGAWTELQVAKPGDAPSRFEFEHWRDDSSFVSLDAMTLMHEAFARALPSFDLFLPRLFAPDALTKLATELDAFASGTSGEIVKTARAIAALARATSAAGKSLWVLGP